MVPMMPKLISSGCLCCDCVYAVDVDAEPE